MGETNGVAEGFDKKEFEAWLRTQPVEVSVVLAARSALRALLFLTRNLDWRMRSGDTFVLPLFRAVNVAWSFGVFGDQKALGAAADRALYAFARAAPACADKKGVAVVDRVCAYLAVARASFFRTAAGKTFFAGASFTGAAFASADKTAIYKSAAAASNAAAAYSAIARALSRDRARLTTGLSASRLYIMPLWPDGMPGDLAADWQSLKAHLLSRNEDWDIWTDWYEDRLAGRPPEAKLDRARIMLPDGLWKQGAKAVNAELKRIRADLQAEGAEDSKAETGNLQGSGLSESGQEPNWHEVVKQRLQDEAPVSAVMKDGRIAARDSPPDAKPPLDHPEDLQARLLGLRLTADKVAAMLGEMPHNLGPYLARDIGHFSQAASQSPPVWYVLDDAAACLRDHTRLLEDLAWPGATREDVERLVRRTEELRLLLQPQQPEPAPAANEKPPLELDPEKATPCAVGEILSQVEGAIRADGGRVLAPSAQQTLEHYTDKAREALASPDTSEASESVRQRRLTRWLRGLGGFLGQSSKIITYGVATNAISNPGSAKTLGEHFSKLFDWLVSFFSG
ncbi:hypothetical protein H1W37_01815 [Stappia taiwanensis]|uniref:Uncharacterized protein n=1 Tax=Stappia taiwanensis TaxID=992267 RepID=A0A838XTJ7_9HYPH|nr:hypothetical protein [Stappia taiwanensis]MBA4610374.1 hypothetical protein [Stappia taiwanensis]